MNNNNNQLEVRKRLVLPVSFPGIEDSLVFAAGIRRCLLPESQFLTGSSHGGILFPYRNLDGAPVLDGGRPFFRLRLDEPENGKKYHQWFGSGVHAYIVPGFRELYERTPPELFLIEGEKKALALAAEGFPAVGLSGFYGAIDGSQQLTNELVECLRFRVPKNIFFMGDSDVLFNPQFSDAAIKLAKMLRNYEWASIAINVWVVPLDAPGKGVDDVRGAMDRDFTSWFNGQRGRCVDLNSDFSKERLAVEMLRKDRAMLETWARDLKKKERIFKGLAKLAAGLGCSLAESEIRMMATELGFEKRPFGKEINQARSRQKTGANIPLELEGDFVDLNQPSGIWTREILQKLREETFVSPEGRLSRIVDGRLVPFSERELVPFLDHPDRFIFIRGSEEAGNQRARFEKRHAELVLGAVIEMTSELRKVKSFSQSPVLVLVDDAENVCQLVTGYSDKQELLVASNSKPWDGDLSFEQAWASLSALIQDFAFPSSSDEAACFSLMLTPALAKGGFLRGQRVPFFVISKDQAGAGGGTLCQLVSAIYGHPPVSITVRNPGRVRESLSRALFEGDSIVYLDNVRGAALTDLPFLESMLTEPNFDGRMIYRHAILDVEHLVLMATSNGMTMSPDLADRSVEIHLHKQPSAYEFKLWNSNGLLEHVKDQQGYYLACVHRILRDWVESGCRRVSPESGLRFRAWEEIVGMIISGRPGSPMILFPGGGSHRRCSIDRLSSPDFDEIEACCRNVVESGFAGQWLTAKRIMELRDDEESQEAADVAVAARTIGRILCNFCPVLGESRDVGESFRIQRRRHNLQENNYKATNEYQITNTI